MLKTEQNTPEIEAEIRSMIGEPDVFFERGQWWVRFDQFIFSVIDTSNGMDLEQV